MILYNIGVSKISVSQARYRFAEVVASAQTEPVELEQHGRRVAVIVSPEQFDAMLETFEEAQDIAAFDASLLEAGDNIPWDQVRSDLGLS